MGSKYGVKVEIDEDREEVGFHKNKLLALNKIKFNFSDRRM